MSLSDLASIGSFASGLAVLISLVYLSLQIRQNSKHTKALVTQNRAERVTTMLLALASSDLAAAYDAANGGGATEQEVRGRQFQLMCAALISGWDDTFSQYEHGLLDRAQFMRFQSGISSTFLSDPGTNNFVAEWLQRQSAAAPELTSFLSFMRDALARASVAKPVT